MSTKLSIVTLLLIVIVLIASCKSFNINVFHGHGGNDDDDDEQCEAAIARLKLRLLYTQIVWPNSANAIKSLIAGNDTPILDEIFSANVSGRIFPLGTFDNLLESAEYFFALAGPLGVPGEGPRTKVVSTSIEQFIFFKNVAAVRAFINFDVPENPGVVNYTLVHQGFFLFNKFGKIKAYDLSVPNLGKQSPAPTSVELTNLCAGQNFFCTGNNTQFANISECITFMNTIELGDFYEVNSNTVACRMVHLILATIDPLVHCPHVGPTGGGKCVDFTYEQFIQTTKDIIPKTIER